MPFRWCYGVVFADSHLSLLHYAAARNLFDIPQGSPH